ncbi:FAS1 domain-containing protein [Sparassis latifolia]
MRLWPAIPLALLALLPLASPSQLPLPVPSAQSTTLLDALSADPDYVSLIKLLQRAKLVPTLNRLNGSTLFAPTNDAIAANSLWQTALDDPLRDNLQENLRQQLFYHLLNYTLTILPTEKLPQEHKTLLYPHSPKEPPSSQPPPNPPWMPIPNGTLGDQPQRLRASHRDESMWVGVDFSGDGGARVVKDRVDTANGVLLGIDTVLEMPPDLATSVSRHSSFPYFVTPEIATFLNSTPELTVFLPIDAAWEALPYYEQLYLQSPFAADDLRRIAHMHAVQGVVYAESFSDGKKLTTIDGRKLLIDSKHVSSADLVARDIYAANGVVHSVSKLLVPPGALRLTTEKYLLTLNCSAFVSLLHSVNLTSLVNGTDAHYTLLAPRDDVISLFGDGELPQRGSEELKRMLQYHFISGKWTPEKLKDGMLLETALEEPGLGGGRQVLSIEVSGEVKGDKNDKSRTVRFGGAGVIGDHVKINNTVIYFVSRPLVPPSDALSIALPELEWSSILAAIFSTNLADTLKTTPRTTLLLPPNDAFKRLGMLVSAHLLAASSKLDLERVIRHHALAGVEYTQSMQNGSQRAFATLEGSDMHVDRRAPNGSVILSASGGWASMQSALIPRDMLTQTGVIHEVSDIMIPRSVELTIGKLVKAAKATTMTTMMVKAGLDWILNGTAPPEGTPWADMGLSGAGWTLLCPTDDAFKEVNLTQLYADDEQLVAIVSQHLIPSQRPTHAENVLNNNRPLALDDSAVYTTLFAQRSARQDGDVLFRAVDEDEGTGTVVGVKDARGAHGQGDWARVLSWGRSTTGGGTGGVIQIDRMLAPYYPPWYLEYCAPLAVGVVGVLGICAFFAGVRALWRRDTTEATYEPIGGFVRDSDD